MGVFKSQGRRWLFRASCPEIDDPEVDLSLPEMLELELKLIQSKMAQKPMLRGEVGARAWRV